MSYLLARTAQGQLSSLYSKPLRSISGVGMDVVFDYAHTASVQITENPTESGVLINDHRIIKPQRIVMNVGVSNVVTPQTLINNYSLDAVVGATKAFIFGNSFDSKSRIALTYSELIKAMYTGEPFNIETPMGLFKNMLIINIEENNDSDTIGLFDGSVTMQEMITIETEAYLSTTNKSGVIKKKEGGQKEPEEFTSKDLVPSSIGDLF